MWLGNFMRGLRRVWMKMTLWKFRKVFQNFGNFEERRGEHERARLIYVDAIKRQKLDPEVCMCLLLRVDYKFGIGKTLLFCTVQKNLKQNCTMMIKKDSKRNTDIEK